MKTAYRNAMALPPKVAFLVDNSDATPLAAITAFVNGLSRPAWYSKPGDETMDTRDYMLNHPEKFGSKLGTVTDPFTNLLLRLWKCVCCGHATTYDGVHLGHITKWKVDLIAAGVTTAAEARAAYNNLNNLRIECSTCNASHDEE